MNSIILNASGINLSPATANACYVRPVRGIAASTPVVTYDTTTFELTYNTSSIKYKKNVVDLQEDTSRIYNVRAREFDAIDNDRHFIGYIAEELQEVDTWFTWKNPDGTPEGIEWFNMLVYAIEELKKLKARVSELESKLV